MLLIDEAQDLEVELLEQVRLLSNLETDQRKLLQIVLIGQPELREKLDERELRQLRQRITVRYHLSPLSREETERYILHRLQVAGANGRPAFNSLGARRNPPLLAAAFPGWSMPSATRRCSAATSTGDRPAARAHVRRAIRELEGNIA